MSRLPEYMWSQPGPDMIRRYADALIEIAADFDVCTWAGCDEHVPSCSHCGGDMTEPDGCQLDCPGLLARRALGVA